MKPTIIVAPTPMSVNAANLFCRCRKSRPESMITMPAATKSGLIVGDGIGMPSSFAVRRSFSMWTGFASAAFSCSAQPSCVCGISDVRSGCVRSHSG